MTNSFDDMDEYFYDPLRRHEQHPKKEIWNEIEKKLNREDRISKALYTRKVILMTLPVFLTATLFPLILQQTLNRSKTTVKMQKMHSKIIQQPAEIDIVKTKGKKASNEGFSSLKPNFHLFAVSDFQPLSWDETNRIHSISTGRLSGSEIREHILSQETIRRNSTSDPVKELIRLKEFGQHRFSLTAYYSKDFAGYNFSDHDIVGVGGKEIESKERNIFSASAGAYVNYRINKKFTIQSGLIFSWSNNRIDSASSYAVKNDQGIVHFQFNSASGYSYLKSSSITSPVVGDSISTANTYTQFRYLTIPLLMSYRFPFGHFSVRAGAGITFNVLTYAALQTVIYGNGYEENESEIAIQGLKKINIGLLVNAELEYQLTNQWSVEIIPSFRNTLSPVNLNSAVSAYPFNLSIGTGVRFSF